MKFNKTSDITYTVTQFDERGMWPMGCGYLKWDIRDIDIYLFQIRYMKWTHLKRHFFNKS